MTRDDPAAFAPPPAFGPFRVLHQIGIGALGPVFRTYEPTRDRLVAVKLFRLDITPEQAQTLAEELARACDAGLFHPSIVEPIAAGVEGTAAYRAEEYVAAESLDVAMRHYAPATLDKALPFITQLAGAIDFARTAGVGHGALHLRDVFVTPDEARASGFGIVESLERVGMRAPVRRPYSAPERIAGASWSTPADVFSLAAIAYELLTARRPSGTGDQIGAVSGEHIGRHAPAIRAVLARAMEDDPGRRYPSALEFASALEAAARGRGVTDTMVPVGGVGAVPPPPIERTETPALAPGNDRAGSGTDLPAHPVDEDEEDAAADADAGSVHPELTRELAKEPAPTLFDAEDDALADLAMEEPPMRRQPPVWQYEADAAAPVTEEPAVHHENFGEAGRPRRTMLPLALTLALLLISFAAGYALGRRGNTAAPTAAAVNAPKGSPPAAGVSSPPQRSGRAWSEQAVTQPPAAAPSSSSTARPPATDTPPVPGDEPSRAAAPVRPGGASTTGRVVITSTPSRAAVTVNGKWRGRTPLTIDGLAFGTHTLRIVQPGFAIARQDVTLSPSQPARTLSVRLERPAPAAAAAPSVAARPTVRPPATVAERFVGSVYVDSRPRGARVFIDGRAFGTTPARIPDVAIGSHVVRLDLADHRIWTASTRVSAGQETRVTGSLDRIQ